MILTVIKNTTITSEQNTMTAVAMMHQNIQHQPLALTWQTHDARGMLKQSVNVRAAETATYLGNGAEMNVDIIHSTHGRYDAQIVGSLSH